MIVEVTAGHIAAGRRRDPGSCAFALAIRDVIGPEPELHVDKLGARIDGVMHKFTHELGDELISFDCGGQIEPIIFEIKP